RRIRGDSGEHYNLRINPKHHQRAPESDQFHRIEEFAFARTPDCIAQTQAALLHQHTVLA
ncbi:hypothetical protein, partial [Ottowia sp.]|uniref:hypothetical protein n=1 Tax=Ottowia sp. TaxID=1898956 RepID=UPI002603B209